jgi:hypothetical protein
MRSFPILSTLVFAMASLAVATEEQAGPPILRSGPARVGLIELFSSEGCSSCPPADRWISSLTNAPGLWREFVPVVFHVDYWDGLGWPDRFASRAFTDRQTVYAQQWGTGRVYTPGFVLNGREWEGRTVPKPQGGDGGILRAELSGTNAIQVTYTAASDETKKPVAHVAWLGFGLINDIRRGENSGRKLRHDFIVLTHDEKKLSAEGDLSTAAFRLPRPADAGTNRLALAVWIQDPKTGRVLQAAGNWAP